MPKAVVERGLSQCVCAATTRYHRRRGIKLDIYSHSSGGWEPKVKAQADLVSGEGRFLAHMRRLPSRSVLAGQKGSLMWGR